MIHKIGIFLIGTLLILSSCSDSIDSPPSDSDDTGGFIGTTFETKGHYFSSVNNHSLVFDFYEDGFGFEPFESDAVLVYRLENHLNGEDIWAPLQLTYFLDESKILTYNYVFNSRYDPNNGFDHIFDVTIFLDGNFDLDTHNFSYEEIFKIVVIPSDFLSSYQIDTKNVENVLKSEHISFQEFN